MDKPEALRWAEFCDGNVLYQPAAAELRRLHELNVDKTEIIAAISAQRDALLEALKSTGLFLHHCWCDVQMNDYSFEKLNRQMEIVEAAIKAVEGEKT